MAVETLRPSGAGNECAWPGEVGAACPNHYQNVDEAVSDDATTMIQQGTVNTTVRDLYDIPAHSVGSGTINSVTVYINARRGAVITGWAKPSIRTHATDYDGDEKTLTDSWVLYSHEWTDNPNTETAWTWDEIDALEIGVQGRKTTAAADKVYITQVYVEVDYTGVYDSPGTLTSINLLSGETVVSIDNFDYNASAIPSGTSLKVQFSQDSTNWYNSSGTPDGWDTLSQGTHSINLSGLGWSGANFYYKMEFISDGAGTPVLDEISVNFSTYYASGDLTSSAYDTGDDSDWGTISFTIVEPSATNIQFQIRTAATEGGLSSATWYGPTGTGDYYTTSGTNINSVHDGDRWIQYKAYFSGPGNNTPTLSDVTITYAATATVYTAEVIGGAYCLVSTDTSEWEEGWTVTPELCCEVTQR